jgi:hypothetical protein
MTIKDSIPMAGKRLQVKVVPEMLPPPVPVHKETALEVLSQDAPAGKVKTNLELAEDEEV